MSEKIVKNWINIAEYDLQTAKAMLKSGRYIYVAFTCQQSIEKILKAVYVKEKNETPPYTHNLLKLLSLLSINLDSDDKKNKFLGLLNSYYIETRYTEQIEELSKALDKNKAKEVLIQTEELFLWLREKI